MGKVNGGFLENGVSALKKPAKKKKHRTRVKFQPIILLIIASVFFDLLGELSAK